MTEKCPTCNKVVYFAERVRSIGKDWHRMCLKCQQCGKVLGKVIQQIHRIYSSLLRNAESYKM